jgi:hypothetical protein
MSHAPIRSATERGLTAGFAPQRENSALPFLSKWQSEPGAPSRTPTHQRGLPSLTLPLALGIFLIGNVLSTGARAQGNQQSGQWCAYFTAGRTDCTFASFAECLDTIRGKTAMCDQHPQYGQPASPRPASVPVKHMRHRATHGSEAGSPTGQESPAGIPAAAEPSLFEDFRELLSRIHID